MALAAAICLSAFFVNAQTTTAVKDASADFDFSNVNYDFGKIPFGKPVEYTLTIKNLGHDSASLDNVSVGCGCTTPRYEKGKKFAPGQTAVVTLGFNGASQGPFTKNATIYLNGGAVTKMVIFKGETYTAPANPAPANAAAEKMKPTGN